MCKGGDGVIHSVSVNQFPSLQKFQELAFRQVKRYGPFYVVVLESGNFGG